MVCLSRRRASGGRLTACILSSNATVQHNQVGPCGTDEQDSWADGISLSCANSVVRSNLVGGATDGGIVIFGAPGTVVEDNIIWPEKVDSYNSSPRTKLMIAVLSTFFSAVSTWLITCRGMATTLAFESNATSSWVVTPQTLLSVRCRSMAQVLIEPSRSALLESFISAFPSFICPGSALRLDREPGSVTSMVRMSRMEVFAAFFVLWSRVDKEIQAMSSGIVFRELSGTASP
jgi:hypothetical protein